MEVPVSTDHFRMIEKEIRLSYRDMCHRKRRYRTDWRDWLKSHHILEASSGSHTIFGDKILQIPGTPTGLYIIKGALSVSQQLHWAKTACEEYSRADHTNLTNLRNLRGDVDIFGDRDIWMQTLRENNGFKRFKELRWASLGYHYDWTARMYQKDLKSPFPSDLADLCQSLAKQVNLDILSEAAIVNYYPSGATMSGHLDDAELYMDEPIVSLSIGCPAVFQIGGRTKDVIPVSILLESGDVVIMGGESRHCFHGVPIVLPHFRGHFSDRILGEDAEAMKDSYADIISYLDCGRININVRRVTHPQHDWIDKQGSGAASKVY